jgi:agmatinase
MTDTFLGARRPGTHSEAGVLGAAVATVYPGREPHATGAAAAIREASQRLRPFVGNHDFDTGAPFASWLQRLADSGDVPTSPRDPEGNRQRISEAVGQMVDAAAMPVLLGGDDSVAIPFVAGWRDHGPITVVHIDAHLDFRDEVDGERFGYSSPMRRASEMAWVKRIIHVGQRGVGSARSSDVADSLAAGNTITTARELERSGAQAVTEQLELGERFVIVYDVDGTDPTDLPSVRAPVPSGPRLATVMDLIAASSARGSLEGLVVTEFEPTLDQAGTSSLALARLICRTLDERFR